MAHVPRPQSDVCGRGDPALTRGRDKQVSRETGAARWPRSESEAVHNNCPDSLAISAAAKETQSGGLSFEFWAR
jgi:hypothetical protein